MIAIIIDENTAIELAAFPLFALVTGGLLDDSSALNFEENL